VAVSFTPSSVGARAATLTINHTGDNTPTTVSLDGTGANPPSPQAPIYRINAGGPTLSGTPAWEEDSSLNPSPFSNAATTGSKTFSTGTAIDMSDPSLPLGTPMAMFQSERWDAGGSPEMQWSFPITPGDYEVRLYFAEIFSGTQSPGSRVFDVLIEGNLVLDNYDIAADVGGFTGVMKSFVVSANSSLDIAFGHEVENPAIKGVEILPLEAANELGAAPNNLDFGPVLTGDNATSPVQLTNLGAPGDPDIEVTSTTPRGSSWRRANRPR
jgi:hypothetical protein